MKSRVSMSFWDPEYIDGVDRQAMERTLAVLTERSGELKTIRFHCNDPVKHPGNKFCLLASYGIEFVDGEQGYHSAVVDANKLPTIVRDLWEKHIGFEGLTAPLSPNYYTAVDLVQMILESFDIYW